MREQPDQKKREGRDKDIHIPDKNRDWRIKIARYSSLPPDHINPFG